MVSLVEIMLLESLVSIWLGRVVNLYPCCGLISVLYGNHAIRRLQQVHDSSVTIVDLL